MLWQIGSGQPLYEVSTDVDRPYADTAGGRLIISLGDSLLVWAPVPLPANTEWRPDTTIHAAGAKFASVTHVEGGRAFRVEVDEDSVLAFDARTLRLVPLLPDDSLNSNRLIQWGEYAVVDTLGALRLIDLRSHRARRLGQSDETQVFGFSRDGSHLLYGVGDTVFAKRTGAGFSAPPERLVMQVSSASFSPDKLFFIISKENERIVCRVGEWNQPARRVPGNVASFSPDGRLMLSRFRRARSSRPPRYAGQLQSDTVAAADTIVLWETEGWTQRATLVDGAPTITASFSPKGQWIRSVHSGGILHLWDGKKGTTVTRLPYFGLTTTVPRFSGDESLFGSVGIDSLARVYSIRPAVCRDCGAEEMVRQLRRRIEAVSPIARERIVGKL